MNPEALTRVPDQMGKGGGKRAEQEGLVTLLFF